jgi:glucoside 3-dehydrogenase (cytochrome c) hitch-hiker subunit
MREMTAQVRGGVLSRRQSLVALSVLAGHALFPDALQAFAGALAQPAGAWHPEVVPPAHADGLAALVDTILPATDTPGARAARVHEFVDLMLARCVGDADRAGVLKALEGLGAGFAAAPAAEREGRLRAVAPATLGLLTDLTVLGFFTSEIGCTQTLAYVAVPGEYKGCIPLAPGQKAWATR